MWVFVVVMGNGLLFVLGDTFSSISDHLSGGDVARQSKKKPTKPNASLLCKRFGECSAVTSSSSRPAFGANRLLLSSRVR